MRARRHVPSTTDATGDGLLREVAPTMAFATGVLRGRNDGSCGAGLLDRSGAGDLPSRTVFPKVRVFRVLLITRGRFLRDATRDEDEDLYYCSRQKRPCKRSCALTELPE